MMEVKIVFCRECKYFHKDEWGMWGDIPIIVAHDICHFWGEGCKTRPDGYCFAGEKEAINE